MRQAYIPIPEDWEDKSSQAQEIDDTPLVGRKFCMAEGYREGINKIVAREEIYRKLVN